MPLAAFGWPLFRPGSGFNLGLSLCFLGKFVPLFRPGSGFNLGLSLCFLSKFVPLFLDLGFGFLRQLALAVLSSPAFRERRTKPGAAGARAITHKSGAQCGDLCAPLVHLAGQVASQNHSGLVQGHNLISQPGHRFSQYTHVCPLFPK